MKQYRLKKKVKIGLLAISLFVLFIVTGIFFISRIKGTINKKNLEGEWYEDGGSMPSFVLYSDGSCEIEGEYGLGTWDVVNKNQLRISNYYGETETGTIESIKNGVLKLKKGSTSSIFTNSPNLNQPGKNQNSNVGNNDENSFTTNNTDSFTLATEAPETAYAWQEYNIEKLYMPVTNMSYEYTYTIEDNGTFWVYATAEIDGSEYLIKTNLKNEILQTIPVPDSGTLEIIDDTHVYVSSKNYNGLYDSNADDVTHMLCGESEKLDGLFEDSTGLSLVFVEDVDTYDSHCSYVRFRTMDGNVKAEYNSDDIANTYDDIHVDSGGIKYLGGSIYQWGPIILNISTGKFFKVENGPIEADDKYIYCDTSRTGGSWNDYRLFDYNGQNITPTNDSIGGRWSEKYLGDGLMLLADHTDYVILDSQGNIPFDANKFFFHNVLGDVGGIGSFHDGIAPAVLKNSGGVLFSTLINEKGDFLFEPIKGKCTLNYLTSMWKFNYILYREDTDESFLFDTNGNLIRYKEGGAIYVKKDDRLSSYIYVEDGQIIISPVEYVE